MLSSCDLAGSTSSVIPPRAWQRRFHRGRSPCHRRARRSTSPNTSACVHRTPWATHRVACRSDVSARPRTQDASHGHPVCGAAGGCLGRPPLL